MTTPTREEIDAYARCVLEGARSVLASIKQIRNTEIPASPAEFEEDDPDDAVYAAAALLAGILGYCAREPTESIGDPVSINDLEEKIELLESLLD